jgi:hypothetical protein
MRQALIAGASAWLLMAPQALAGCKVPEGAVAVPFANVPARIVAPRAGKRDNLNWKGGNFCLE